VLHKEIGGGGQVHARPPWLRPWSTRLTAPESGRKARAGEGPAHWRSEEGGEEQGRTVC
jgi:hypothetical protein